MYWSALLYFCCFVEHRSVTLHPVLSLEVFSCTKSGWGEYSFKSPKAGVRERGVNHLHVTLMTYITTRASLREVMAVHISASYGFCCAKLFIAHRWPVLEWTMQMQRC